MLRIVSGQLVALFLFGLLISINLLWQFQKDGDGETDRGHRLEAKAILHSVESRKANVSIAEHLDVLNQFSGNAHQIYTEQYITAKSPPLTAVRYLDAQNKELFRSINFPKDLIDIAHDDTKTILISNAREWRSISYKSPSSENTLQLAKTTETFNAEIWPYIQRYILTPLLWFLPLSTLATFFVVAKGLRPLKQLANLIANRTEHDLSPIVHFNAYTETRPVVDEINSLLRRLAATLKRERSFLADAAHELRTPLAVIQVQAEVLTNTEKLDEKVEAASELQAGIERTAALLQKLLMIAKVDPDSFRPRFQEIELSSFVQDRVASMAPLALKKLIDVEMISNQTHRVEIDPESFTSAVENVLDNAIRYTPSGEKLRICIHTIDRSWVALTVSDSGPGIPKAYISNVFERFFRVPGTEQSGSGLGLAIVSQVMARHQGEVSLSDGLDGKGLSVCLKLPSKCADLLR
jgi:signal transduction histidine kinase